MHLNTNKIKEDFTRLNPEKEWSFSSVGRQDTMAVTHSYHRYPAKFIPQIVEKLINDNTELGDLICDPFGGCGTTSVESKRLGRSSIAFDINPIAKLITLVKTTPISSTLLNKHKELFLNIYARSSPVTLEHHPRINYWFDESTLIELDKIYLAIKEIHNYNVRRFFLCAFSHNLKTCSRWLMKSIKPTIDQNKIIPDPMESFLRHLNSMIKKNEEFYNELQTNGNIDTTAKMYRRDATKKFPIASDSVDLVITSPPYVTSYEYADLHQLSLLWFGSDPKHFKKWHRFSNEFNDFRKDFIGTSHKQERGGSFNSKIAENITSELSSIDRPLAIDVANYYLDMKKVFGEIYRVLKPGSKASIIIGNTQLRGVGILNAEVAAQQMLNTGFERPIFIKREVSNKMITPWRDSVNGKFTSMNNPTKKRIYEYEYIIIAEKTCNY